MITVPASVKDLMRKIYALSIHGVRGESDTARRKLDILLEKHNVTIDDLMEETTKTYQFIFKNELDERLLVQLYYAVTKDRERKVWSYSRFGKNVSRKIGLDLTAEQYVDFQEQLAYYRAIWKKELELMFSAFCHKHDLLRPADASAAEKPPSEEDLREYMRIKQMMRGFSEKTYFKPAALVSCDVAARTSPGEV